jgi:alanine-glyoxylate transaminase/(R)-3-amino-2-methylpropionate-pyruvate transaminase
MDPDTPDDGPMRQPALPPCDHQPRAYTGPSADEVLALRRQFMNPGIFLYYKKPLMVVEGHRQYVWDEKGKRYLDGLGGIVTVSVGHCHPHVVAAGNKQNEIYQHSTTIYLHPNVARYAEKLASKMPGDLKMCYFVNSGSEANDLAILMARAYTGNFDLIALRNAYHGGSHATMGATAHGTWKYNLPQAFGIHHALAPYPYRGAWGYDDPQAGLKYANDVREVIDYSTSGRIAGFIAESIQGVGGFVEFPHGYLENVYRHVRAAGGVCIADEVQTGLGRTGTHFWGFENHGVIPDIVTLAKGLGNGCPLGAVVTTPEVARALTEKVHFNTFGGNPVASAMGHAVLEVIEKENLQENARITGGYILAGFNKLKEKHEIIGDVRGKGLMLGMEMVKDRSTKEPATAECAHVLETARDLGLLLGKGGLRGQVIRFAPPMCITKADADFLLEVLDESFGRV